MNEPDMFTATIQIGGALVLCYCALMIGRAIAARIAGDKYEAVLGMALISISVAALPNRRGESSNENEMETDNTTTQDNTGKHGETLLETPQVMSAHGLVSSPVIVKITDEEEQELLQVRHEALDLLARCVKYYQDNETVDDGTIPRYDEIKMKSSYRGAICKNLEYSGWVSIIKNQRTFVVPEIGTCATLRRSIIDNRRRVYPVGYAERQKELRDSAVLGLPETKTHDYQ